MACTFSAPCGGVKRLVLALDDREIYECLAAHSLIIGAPAPAWRPDAIKVRPPKPRRQRPVAVRTRRRYCRWGRCRALAWRASLYCTAHQYRATRRD
jgi:hypothetical protein